MDEKELETIKEHLEWGFKNLDFPLNNLDTEQVEWLIKQAEKLRKISKAWQSIEFEESESTTDDFYDDVKKILNK